jgi:histidinol dehydrogenase
MIKVVEYPNNETLQKIVQRPLFNQADLTRSVLEILNEVKLNGDKALINFTKKFDGTVISELSVSPEEINNSIASLSDELKDAIKVAKQNIEKFHSSQIVNEGIIETTSGVNCWRKNVGIEKVGLYIPGGTAPLFSTILMLGIPANLAGCKEIVLCTPPDSVGNINPAILFTANLVGISKIFKIGGAQAIAAMAYGTESIPKVYKIFGPGNQYVTKAKELVQQDDVAIDMPAGPSELLVIADKSSVPSFVAADLLSQAEHGKDSQVILLSNNKDVIKNVLSELDVQLENMPRKEVAIEALKNSYAVLLPDLNQCIDFSNFYAPEHLILAIKNAEKLIPEITNAGSVFLGNYSCESAGDYASGTNHTLPTNGFAKNYSGVSIDSFVKKITFQKLSDVGIKNIGKSIELMAEAEGLYAHKNAITVRLKYLENV